MPINWTPENVSRLFLITLAVHNIHMDYKQIAATFGEEASPRAIEEKMKKLRKEFREFSVDANGYITANPGVGTTGRRGRASSSGVDIKTDKDRNANHKGRARPVKYEDGQIKWEYENREDDSEEDDGIGSRGYGDLMECYLLKKEAVATRDRADDDDDDDDDEDNVPLLSSRIQSQARATHQPHIIPPYQIFHPIFSPASYSHDVNGELSSVMDPMLMQSMNNITFHPPPERMQMQMHHQLHGDPSIPMMPWDHNQNLNPNRFTGISSEESRSVAPINLNNLHMYMGPSRAHHISSLQPPHAHAQSPPAGLPSYISGHGVEFLQQEPDRGVGYGRVEGQVIEAMIHGNST